MTFPNRLLPPVFLTLLIAGLGVQPVSLSNSIPQSSQPTMQESPQMQALLKELETATSISLRQGIIARNAQLITPELIEALIKRANPVPIQKDFAPCASLNLLALGLAQRIGHPKGIALAVHNLGVIYRKTKQYDLAARYHEQSFSIFQKLNDREGISQTYRSVAIIHYEQQNYTELLKCYLDDLPMAKETGQPYPLARAYYNLGAAYKNLELFDQAIKSLEQCLTISRAIENPKPEDNVPGLIADALMYIGSSYYAKRQFDPSIASYQEAARLYHGLKQESREAMALGNLGNVHLEAGDFDKGMEFSRDSLAIRERINSSTVLPYRNIALLHKGQKDFPAAIKTIEQVRSSVEKDGERRSADWQRLWEVYRAEGIIRYAAGQPQQARAALDQAISLIERQNARIPASLENGPTSLGYQYSPYGWMVALLNSQGETEEALYYAERSKSRFLYDVLSNPAGRANQFTDPANLQERQRLLTEILELEMQIAREEYGAQHDGGKIASLQSQLQQAKAALNTVQGKIAAELNALADRWPRESRLTRQDLAALLPDEQTALLQFAMSEEQEFLFVATKSGGILDLRAYPLKLRKHHIREGVDRFLGLIAHRDQGGEIDRLARQWHDKLLGSAQPQLEKIRALIIVPDGPLWEMPFQALKTADNHFLIESRSIAYAPSFNVLRRMSQPIAHAAPDFRLLAFGNPALSPQKRVILPGRLMDDSLVPLPEAEKQVNLIRRSYGPQNSTVLTGNLATEARFKVLAPKYGILHIAAHGLYNDLNPMRSSLVLSQVGKSADEDGFLEAREIIRLKLNADLAILSACETGRGEVRDGEGIIGLPYALFVAGCPTTVVSQWKVSAQSTADLMVALHTQLTRQHASKAEALRQAEIALIRGPKAEYRHPFYWAGFIVFGKAN